MHATHPSLADAARRFADSAHSLSDSGVAGARARADINELLSVLAEQEEWRIYVDGTRNFGHQASSVMLLRRLIELTSFRGRVTVVYAEPSTMSCATAGKLALMFSGVNPTQLDAVVARHGSCDDIRFLPLSAARKLQEVCAFGFTGGADEMSLNGASVLNVCYFMRLQPYLWDDPPTASAEPYYECSRIERPDGAHLYPVQAWPQLRTLGLPPPKPLGEDADPWRWYVEQQRFDLGLACRMGNVRSLLEARAEHAALLWPVYGLQHFRDRAAGILLSCTLLALHVARRRRKPVLLCSMSAPWDLPGALEIVAQKAGPAALHVHHAFDGSWRDIGATLRTALVGKAIGGSVHLVEVGPIAMDAFHQCLAQADLPCIVEGQASANLLATLGKPFLQLLRADHVIRECYPRLPDDAASLAHAGTLESACAQLRDLYPRAAVDRLAGLVDDACEGSLHRYFCSLARHFAQPQHDKLMVMLLALREAMLAA